MNVELRGRIRSIFERKAYRFIAIGVAALLVFGAGYLLYVNKINPKSKNVAVAQSTMKVSKGDLSVTVTGAGSITSSNRLEVTPQTEGTITKVYFKEGDTVKSGDLMFEMDDYAAKLSVEKIKTNIADAQLTQKNNVNGIAKLSIRAPFKGQISNLSVKEGDTLGKNSTLFTLKDQSKLKMTVSFNAANYGQVTKGMTATVNLQSLMQSVNGTVNYVGNKTYSTSMGGEIFDVEIMVENPGSLNEGIKASAEIETDRGVQYSTNNGTLNFINNSILKTDTGGTISKINVREGQFVGTNEVVIEFTNDELVLSKDSYDVNLMDYQGQLESAIKELGYYKIYASIDGTIVKQSTKVGNVVKSGAVISTVADGKQLEFPVSIDELDIAKIKVGQPVNVTIDALTSTVLKPLEGEVSKIAIEGTSSNGVTTYPVTIKVKNPDLLRGGMNANAEIMVENKKGVLLVPIEAVTKIAKSDQAYVWVKGQSAAPASGADKNANASSGTSRQGNTNSTQGTNSGAGNNAQGSNGNSTYYANAVRKQVVLGINNETYIEIVSGLSKGEEIILPQATTTSKTNTTTRAVGGIGGVMGGPPVMGGNTGGKR